MKIQQIKLQNELDTLFINVPEATTGSVQIWFRAGSALESPADFGIAHFLEHMFFKGTHSRPGPSLTKEIESFGGEVNAFTSFDYTCYYINTPQKHINQSIEILLDMVTDPVFKLEDLLPERDVVFEEYRRSLDSPTQFAFKQIQKTSFTRGYAHPILGNEKTITQFHRDQLIHFRNKHYNLKNALLVVSGNLKNQKKTISLIEKFKLPPGEQSQFPPFQLKSKNTLQIHNKEVRMAQLSLVIMAPPYLDEFAGREDLAINCLGHGETSRLYKDLVLESSTANHCSASTMYFSKGGAHFIKISCPPDNVPQIYRLICSCLKKVLDKGLSNQEVDKIKNQYLASKIYEKESIESLAFSLGHGFAQNGNIHCEEEFIENIRKAGKDQVNASFQNIFSRPIHLNLQIPMEQKISQFRPGLESFQKELSQLVSGPSLPKILNRKPALCPHDPQVRIVQLKKGIKLLYRKNRMTPTFIFHAFIKGGLSLETAASNGIHHLISGVMTKGHHKIPYEKIKTSLEEKSASLAGFSGKNTYGLTLHGQTAHFEEFLPNFFGPLTAPDFLPKFVTHEKKMVQRVLENQKEDPVKQCFKKVSSLFFEGHPYSMDVLGTSQNLPKMGRQELEGRHRRNMAQNEILFTYGGDLSLERVVALTEPFINTLKPRPEKKLTSHAQRPVFGKICAIPFDREQTQIFMGIPSFPMGHKKEVYLKILTTFLSGQSSDLFVEVRDRQGLCYSVHPIHFSALEGGYWGIYMAAGHDKVERAVSAIKKILGKIQKKGLPSSELARIKKMIDGQNLLNLQTNEDYAGIYSIPLLHGLGINHFYETNKMIHQVSHQEFNGFLQDYLQREFNQVVVGRNL